MNLIKILFLTIFTFNISLKSLDSPLEQMALNVFLRLFTDNDIKEAAALRVAAQDEARRQVRLRIAEDEERKKRVELIEACLRGFAYGTRTCIKFGYDLVRNPKKTFHNFSMGKNIDTTIGGMIFIPVALIAITFTINKIIEWKKLATQWRTDIDDDGRYSSSGTAPSAPPADPGDDDPSAPPDDSPPPYDAAHFSSTPYTGLYPSTSTYNKK